MTVPAPRQPTLAEIGTPLSRVTFVVVDLETTGGSPAGADITEIGAVKVRGGEVLGEFQTLVNPGTEIPPFIASLTGITTAMVRQAPSIAQVLPTFLEWARGAVLVAHNAPFDVGFLKAAARELGHPWPGFAVVDTVQLARRALTRDEVPNHKLATLARYVRATVDPDHRALSDARATVDVLHALLERLASFGVTHMEDLATAAERVSPAVRAKRSLADGLPEAPGVYQFVGPGEEVLYVGTATNLRSRVRSYFTAGEKRRRMTEMVTLALRVDAVACGTVLEARVRELRLITTLAPRYNRRSKFPERMPWVRLTLEPFPRLSCVTQVRGPADVGDYLGPFASRRGAQGAIEALEAAFPVRRCQGRLPRTAAPGASACSLAGLGRCGAPCVPGGQDAEAYGQVVWAVRRAIAEDPGPLVQVHAERIARLTAQERYEEAAVWRDRATGFLRAAARTARSARLSAQAQLVAARRTDAGGWELVVIRHGRLAATATTPARSDPMATLPALMATAEHVEPPSPPATAAHPEEAELLADWLDQPGVRLLEAAEGWACAVRGPEAWVGDRVAAAVAAHAAPVPDGVDGVDRDGPDPAEGGSEDRSPAVGGSEVPSAAVGAA